MEKQRRPSRPVIGNRRVSKQQRLKEAGYDQVPRREYVNKNPYERRREKSAKRARKNSNANPNVRKVKQSVDRAVSSQNVATIKKRSKPFVRLLWFLVIVLILLFAATFVYARVLPLNPDLSGNYELYNISSNAAAVASSHQIANVAVFGVDGREDVEGDRSDAIMIGSADFEHNSLKVTSLMRDTYVDLAGLDYFDKLNAAYSQGGPMEALKTINENFDTAITDYVVVDFTALVAVVNSVGGVDITITDEDELYWLNQYLMDVNDKVGTQDPDVPGTGPQHLTGSQALSYARIRYTGNGDYDRTQRQRNILEQVVAKASQMNPIEQVKLVQSVLPYVETSLRTSELFRYGLNFLIMRDKTIAQFRLPADGLFVDGYLDDVSYIFPMTLVDNIKAWYNFVYQIDYTPSARAQEISEEIEYTWYE